MMTAIAESNTLFEIDAELNDLLDEIDQAIETNGEAPVALMERFQEFCQAHGEKVDRIGRYLRMMEARTAYCRSEASRLYDRARSAERKGDQTKGLVLYYLKSRGLKKLESLAFTLRMQQNSQDSVKITDEHALPLAYQTIEVAVAGSLWQEVLCALPESVGEKLRSSIKKTTPDLEAIRHAPQSIPGTDVKRGEHLRVT